MNFRRDTAALAVAAMAVAVGLLALQTGAGLGAPAADVQLQVVPRGPGTVLSSVPDKITGETACTKRSEPVACDWVFEQGTAVVLTGKPEQVGCELRGLEHPGLSGDGAVPPDRRRRAIRSRALFSELTLEVDMSGKTEANRSRANRRGSIVRSSVIRLRRPVDGEAESQPGHLEADELSLRMHVGRGQRVHRDDARRSAEGRSAVQRLRAGLTLRISSTCPSESGRQATVQVASPQRVSTAGARASPRSSTAGSCHSPPQRGRTRSSVAGVGSAPRPRTQVHAPDRTGHRDPAKVRQGSGSERPG